MKVVGIYIQDSETLDYNRVDLFDDEKISVTSSIQNINDISKTYTDYSNTYTVPASKQNNKIFKHWYDNSNDAPFSTLTKSNAYIEIDTIPFRKGKIQLESANLIDGHPKDYSITFIGILGNLKDTFSGKYLKDLTLDTSYDFNYTANEVISRVVSNAPSQNVMWPLISSKRRWNYQNTTDPTNNINDENYPIRYNELFPAIRLRAVLNMIETQFGINFDGTTEEPSAFLSDARFTNAYLYLKNGDGFETNLFQQIDFTTLGTITSALDVYIDLAENYFQKFSGGATRVTIIPQSGYSGVSYTVFRYLNGAPFDSYFHTGTTTFNVRTDADENKHTFFIQTTQNFIFQFKLEFYDYSTASWKSATMNTQTLSGNISIRSYFPEIKIEDFFSGLLKMFNLTCYSNDGINYTVEQLESYYGAGSDIDITKYVLQDNKSLNRVKTYKKINFEYEKSESFVNVAFNSNAGIEYGSLRYENIPKTEGEEYSIKLPFEDLNFSNLFGLFQVGYCLKTDNQEYIPKPIILYDYNPAGNIDAGVFFYTSESLVGTGQPKNLYKAFGQETLISGETYGLNFPPQQSTLTNEIVDNGLYLNYYSNYFNNIYNLKARLIKVSAILPTSILTTLKLNDSIIIRDAKYLINSYTTNLTTGLVEFELLTDQRVRPDKSLVLNLDAGNTLSYPGSGTLWTDLSIYGNNGTLINGATFNSANGGSIVFDGTNDFADFGNILNYTTENFTFSYWVYFNSLTTNQVGQGPVIIYKGAFQTNGYYDQIQNGAITFTTNQSGTNQSTNTNTGLITINNWYNISYVRTGPSIRIYLNGIDSTNTTGVHINPVTSSDNFRLSNYSNGYIYSNIKLAEFINHNRALTPTEVLQNFNATKGRYGL